MGFKFRKSFTIIPGVKINFGKKSTGISIGGKCGGVSFNSKSGARVRASIPGTGISFSEKLGGSSGKRKNRKKSVTKRDLELQEAQNYVRIIKESASICRDTLDPETFFSRYELIHQTAIKLLLLSNQVPVPGDSLENLISRMESGENEDILEFINRYYDAQLDSAQELKTPKGRANRMSKALETLMKQEEHLDAECKQVISELWSTCREDFGGVEA